MRVPLLRTKFYILPVHAEWVSRPRLIALYWNALMLFFPHKVGAIGVNVAILACLLGANWPTEAAIGF